MSSDPWGRVDEQGNVYVRTADGERQVGSLPGGTPEEALAYFVKKYEGLVVKVDLLVRAVRTGARDPKDAQTDIAHLKTEISEANAVGDLAAQLARLEALTGVVDERREEKKAAKARAQQDAQAAKEKIAVEAEQLAASTDWKSTGERLRGLVDAWKAVPRLDKKADDELWNRFAAARSAFAKRRKAHFAELDEQRDVARKVKEKLVTEAEALSSSTDWAGTSADYRTLMDRWKAAGRAPREVEDELWAKFRAAQDVFFAARSEVYAERDSEQQANQALKEALLVEAEALLPIKDLKATKAALNKISDRWEEIGFVPRDAKPKLEARLNAVERVVRDAEEDLWRRSNPEARARAQAAVDQLQAAIDKLRTQEEKARAAGNDRKVKEAKASIAARGEWLTEAKKALEEFSA